MTNRFSSNPGSRVILASYSPTALNATSATSAVHSAPRHCQRSVAPTIAKMKYV